MADHEEYLKAIADAVNGLATAMTESNERTSGKVYSDARKAGIDVREAGNKKADEYDNSTAGKLADAKKKAKFKEYQDKFKLGGLAIAAKIAKEGIESFKEALVNTTERITDFARKISGFSTTLSDVGKDIYNAGVTAEEEKIARETDVAESGFINFFRNISNWWNKQKLDVNTKNSNAKALGISDMTYDAYKKQLDNIFNAYGFDDKSRKYGVASYIYAAEKTNEKYGLTGGDALNALINGEAGGYGLYGKDSLQFEGWLYNQGLLKDYMNQAEIEAYYAQYITEMADLMMNNTDALTEANETNAKLGLQAQAVGKGLQSFDEVLNLSAKSTDIPTISTNKEGKIAVNNEKTITKEKEKQYKNLQNYVKDMLILAEGEDAMVQALVDQGYSLEYAKEKVKGIIELMETDRQDEGILEWIRLMEQDTSITLEDIEEMDNIIRNMTGKSLIITASLEYSDITNDLETFKKLFSGLDLGSTEFDINSLAITDEEFTSFTTDLQSKLDKLTFYINIGEKENPVTPEIIDAVNSTDYGELFENAEPENFEEANKQLGGSSLFKNTGITKESEGTNKLRDIVNKGHATGGIITQQELSWLAEGNKAEAVIPLETQGGIDYLAAAMQKAGGTASGTDVVVNCTLNGELLEMNDYSVRRLGDKLADIIQNRINQRGDINYGN